MSIRTYATEIIPESSTAVITIPLLDEDGNAIADTDLDTLTFDLREPDGTVVNNRSNVDILDAGPGTVDASGVLTLTLAPADTALASGISAGQVVRRVIVLQWTYGSGSKTGRHEVWLPLAAIVGVA